MASMYDKVCDFLRRSRGVLAQSRRVAQHSAATQRRMQAYLDAAAHKRRAAEEAHASAAAALAARRIGLRD
jgi:hypothetical protein